MHVTGLARIITYATKTEGTETKVVGIANLIEGQVGEGVANGFVRVIDAPSKMQYIGYLIGTNADNKGIMFKDFALKYYGKYTSSTGFTTDPQTTLYFKDFGRDTTAKYLTSGDPGFAGVQASDEFEAKLFDGPDFWNY